MELAVKKEELAFCRCAAEKSVKQTLDLAWNLPDYCADMQKILHCAVTPCINGVSFTGGRVTAVGEIQVRLLYLNDAGVPDSFNETAELSVSAELGDLPEDAQVLASAAVDYVNARAASPRRITLGGAVRVLFRAFCRGTQNVLCALEDDVCQTKTQTVSCVHLCACVEKTFDLSETVELPAELQTIGKVLRTGGRLRLDSKKAVNDKLLLQGDLCVEVLYLADTDERTPQRFTHHLPISQIIDVPDIDEDCLCDVTLHLLCLQVQPRADAAGNLRLLELAAKCSAFVQGYAHKKVPVVTDCYATRGKLTAQRQTVRFCQYVQPLAETVFVKQSVETGEQAVTEIVDAHVQRVSFTSKTDDQGLELNAQALLQLLCKTSDSCVYLEKTMDFSQRIAIPGGADNVQCTPSCQCDNVRARLNDDSTVEVSFDCLLRGEIYRIQALDICVDASLSDEAANEKHHTLTLYFSQAGEALWDIAKHYATTTAAIQSENALTGERVEDDRILLVPRVSQ